MSIATVRDEMVKFYAALLPGVDVRAHGGSFDLDELKRVSTRAPALLIAALAIPDSEVQGSIVAADVSFGAFAVAASTVRMARDSAALAMVETVLSYLPGQRWNSKANGPPKEIAASNLYSAELDLSGLSLWVMNWVQEVDIEPVTDGGNIADLLKVYTEFDVATADDQTDAEDHIDLEGAGE